MIVVFRYDLTDTANLGNSGDDTATWRQLDTCCFFFYILTDSRRIRYITKKYYKKNLKANDRAHLFNSENSENDPLLRIGRSFETPYRLKILGQPV